MSNKIRRPLALVILDGFGFSTDQQGNATIKAAMPTWNRMTATHPWLLINAAGPHVGLLPGYIGNSEVGHLTIGAGRVVQSMLKRFHDAIDNKSFFANPLLKERFSSLVASGKTLHLMGIASDGGAHGHIDHMIALIKLAHACGLKKIMIHAFLDGRDVAPKSAEYFLQTIETTCLQLGCGQIASIHGRFYAMDRDKNWQRTQATYNVLCSSIDGSDSSWRDVIKASYARDIYDEFIEPTKLIKNGYIAPGDGIVFSNFRPDRARQLAECFLNPHIDQVTQYQDRVAGHGLAFMVSATSYDSRFAQWKNDVIFEHQNIEHTLLDELASQSDGRLHVFSLAETEKYAHVTYFFRGMVDKQLPNETRMIVASQKARNYVCCPEMSAKYITKQIGSALEESKADVFIINYANADMVGHTGNLQATITACEVIDQQLTFLYQEIVEKRGGTLMITADHGNAEEQIDSRTGEPHTAHTLNPVPFIIIMPRQLNIFRKDLIPNCITESWKDASVKPYQAHPTLGLSNIAPTILTYLGFSIPSVMNQSLI